MEPGSRSPSTSSVVSDFLDEDDSSGSEEAREEEEAAELLPEAREEQLESFYNQTVGAVFVWTMECVILALVHLCLYLLVDALLSRSDGATLLVEWCSWNIAIATAVVACGNAFVANMQREPGIFSRHYMMCTQAYCGTLSYVGLVYSTVAYESLENTAWRNLFIQGQASYLAVTLVLIVVANNVQWIVSLFLTYSCTPFGQSNAAFFQIPVGAALVVFLVIVNETATNGLIVCQGVAYDNFAYVVANAFILSSALLDVCSAIECDPFGILPEIMHSSLYSRARFDPWGLLHGTLLIICALVYGAVARLSRTVFFGVGFTLLFILVTTVLQSFDLRYVADLLLHAEDEDERRVRALQEALAVSFKEAKRIKEHTIPSTRRRVAHRATSRRPPEKPPRKHHVHRDKLREAHEKPGEHHERPEEAHEKREHHEKHRHGIRWRGPQPEPTPSHEKLREARHAFEISNKRDPLPSTLAIFPHIPVTLRRTVN